MSNEDKDDRPEQEQVAKESETDVKRKRKRKRSRKKKKGQEDDGEDSLDSSSRTVYVEGISYDASEEDLEKHFGSACSSIKDIRMPRWQDSGKPRGYAHIDFDTVEDEKKALKLNRSELLGRYLKVDVAKIGDLSMPLVLDPRAVKIFVKNCRTM